LPNVVKFDWNHRLSLLRTILNGLKNIHKLNLVHCDLHDGNILLHNSRSSVISDLGMCKPVSYFNKTSTNKDDIYGVLPYIAPEVLRGKPYTPASDIYSFSMIMWEVLSGVPPFDDRTHDLQLSLSICEGERPEIITNSPECYINLMKKCWDPDPLKRPSALEALDIIDLWLIISKHHYEDKCNICVNNETIKRNIDEIIKEVIDDVNQRSY
jgi:serine/threonine protein kinase